MKRKFILIGLFLLGTVAAVLLTFKGAETLETRRLEKIQPTTHRLDTSTGKYWYFDQKSRQWVIRQ